MKRVPTLFLILMCIAALAGADWQEAENLGPTINTQYGEWYPVLARDGSYMIFVSDRPGGLGQTDLWISYRGGGDWQSPQNLGPSVNTAFVESAPFLAADDTILYFASFAPGGYGNMDIWWCPLTNGVPGPKTNIGPPINGAALDCCPVMSSDGSTFYFCSNRAGGFGSMDGWVSERTGDEWGTPVNMGSNINSPQTDCPRWISDDGNTLIISSTRLDGYGNADIWYSVSSGDEWGELVNLGICINTYADEWGPGFDSNEGAMGGIIYFGSARNGGHGGRDLWRSPEEASGVIELPPIPRTRPQTFPNPQISETTISYSVSETARVVIRLYDVEGRLIRTLLDRQQSPAEYTARWDATTDSGAAVPAGVYFCKMQVGTEETTLRLVVRKE